MAIITTFYGIDMSNRNFYDVFAGSYASNVGTNIPYNGYIYPDVLEVLWRQGSNNFDSLFGGNNLRYTEAGGYKIITGGTATGYLEFYWNGSSYVQSFLIEGMNIPAATLFNAFTTPSTADDLQITQQQLLGADIFNGSPYNDVLIGYGGNDTLDGGAGTDTAVFTGSRSQYSVSGSGASVTVSDNVAGRDGVDTLRNFEFIRFSDQTISTDMSPTYSLAASSASVNEGSTATFILSTTNVAAGMQVAYTLSGVSAADVQDGALTGTTTVGANGQATISVALLADTLTEGAETLTVTVAGKTASTAVNDTSVGVPTYSLVASSAAVNEGATATFILTTTNVITGTQIAYTLSGVSAADIQGGALTGTATIGANGQATISIPVLADRLTEGLETLTLAAAGRTSSVKINDTSVPLKGGIVEFYTAYNMAAAQTWFGSVTGNTASQLTITDGYHTTVYYGQFRYNGNSVAGTLTGLAEYAGSSLSSYASGVSVDASLVAQYVNANQPQNVFPIALANSDTIIGSSGNDVVFSYAGDDFIQGNGGNDTLDGGGGTDTAVFTGSRSQYSISGSGTSITVSDNVAGRDGVDTLRNFEFLKFSDQTILTDMSGLNGTSGSDIFRITSGSNSIDGGAGSDIVQYQTTRSAASITLNNGTITVSKAGGTDTITGVERIDFTDGDLVFDVTSANAPAAYRLYGGAFARTPDEGGFRFWASRLDEKASLRDVASQFISSGEFIGRYGSSLSNAAFVDALYQNVLSRGGDAGGVDYWNDVLNKQLTDRASVLVEFTQLPEFVGISAANITNGYWVV